jgi:hypothetical protein
LSFQDSFLYRDVAAVHGAAVQDFKRWLSRKDDLPYSLDIASTDFFPRSEVRAGWHFIVPGQLQDKLWWGVRTVAKVEFAKAIQRRIDRSEKCICSSNDWIKKSPEVNKFFNDFVKLISFHFIFIETQA